MIIERKIAKKFSPICLKYAIMSILGGTKNNPKLEINKSERAFIDCNFTQPSSKNRVRKSIPMILEGKGMCVRATMSSPKPKQPKTIAK